MLFRSNTYEVYNFISQDWQPVVTVEELLYIDNVYSINTEPYDNFFTDNMLVLDRAPETN